MKKTRTFKQSVTAAPHMVWCVLFIIAPMLFVLYYSFTDKDGKFTLDNIKELFDAAYLTTFGHSIFYALIATLICLVISYPLASAICKFKPHTQQLCMMLIMLPMWTNFLIRTYTLTQILEKNGIINSFLGLFGIEPIEFLGTGAAVVFGMVYNFLPYMVLPIHSVLSKMDNRLIEAAADLGCTPARTLFLVKLPLSLSGIISGVTMVFVPSISTFYISQVMSKRTIILVGDAIERQFMSNYNYNMGAALSLVLMILVILSMRIMNRYGDGEEGVVA
jgi:spermidine/putrescine transport system permease protein